MLNKIMSWYNCTIKGFHWSGKAVGLIICINVDRCVCVCVCEREVKYITTTVAIMDLKIRDTEGH